MTSIDISEYLEKSSDRRGICKDCGTEVYWTVANLSSHKRKSCIISEDEKPLWVDPYVSVDLKNIDLYLENKNPVTRRGICKSCGTLVYWTNLHLASHKRSRCNISPEERLEWDPKSADDASKSSRKRMSKKILNISDYLEDKDGRRGNCKVCGEFVRWGFHALVSHKRRKCDASEKINEMWIRMENYSKKKVTKIKEPEPPKNDKEIRVTSTDIISEYLQDKDVNTRRGTCRVCFASVFWSINHLSGHKLRKCPIPEDEKASWTNLKEKLADVRNQLKNVEVNIGQYLTDKNSFTRRGTCKVCQMRVYWATLHLVSHKKSKCPIPEEEKEYWKTIKKGNSVSIYVEKESDESMQQDFDSVSYFDEDEVMKEETIIDGEEVPTAANVETTPETTKLCCSPNDTSFNDTSLSHSNHKKIHQNSLICDFCQKSFRTKHNLKIHIFSHIRPRTKKSYKEIDDNTSINKLAAIFDISPANNALFFEEVLIKQENPIKEDVITEEVPYNKNNQEFRCCGIDFMTFLELSTHQYTHHTETFRTMLESMREQVLALLSPENVSQDDNDFVNESPNMDESEDQKQDDPITSNVNVECFICQTELPALSYDKHLSTIHPLEDAAKAKLATNKFHCNCCTATFKTVSLCISHLKRTWHQHSGTSCNICKDEFQNLREVNAHRKLAHKRSEKPTCETCQSTFSTVQGLSFHKLTHRGIKRRNCALCGYRCLTQEKMDQHMIKHENEPESICPHCGIGYKGIVKLKKHVYDKHTRVLTLEERRKPLSCKQCDTVCLGRNQLNNHIKKYHRERKFKCSDCAMTFITERLLSNHRVTHTQEISFFCDLCEKGFTRKLTMQKHRKTHDVSTLKYFCAECNKGFRDKCDMARHMKRHTGQKDERCDECQAIFFERYQLHAHMIKIHGHGLADYKSTKINVAYKSDLEKLKS